MGPKKSPFQDALQPLWEKIWNLEGAIGDVHPKFAQRTVKRMEELAELTKNHANEVLRIANDQRVALGTVVHESKQCHANLEETTSRCQKSLEDATARHSKEAHELRYELFGLKQVITQRSTEYGDERDKSMAALKTLKDDLEALKVNVEALKVLIFVRCGSPGTLGFFKPPLLVSGCFRCFCVLFVGLHFLRNRLVFVYVPFAW